MELAAKLQAAKETPNLRIELLEAYFSPVTDKRPALLTLGVRGTNLSHQQTTLADWRLEVTYFGRLVPAAKEPITGRLGVLRESAEIRAMNPSLRAMLVGSPLPIRSFDDVANELRFPRGIGVFGYFRFSLVNGHLADILEEGNFHLTLIDALGVEHHGSHPRGRWQENKSLVPL